jgi:nucleotide-binding universal stress UspA family protein
MITLNNILVATDFGEASEAALRYGRELAKRFDATLHVLTVAENPAIATIWRGDVRGGRTPAAEEIEAAARQAPGRSAHRQRTQRAGDTRSC